MFVDIVGYSKLLLNQQAEVLRELNELVNRTSEVERADSGGKLVRLPTGDGMALVFRTGLETPVECAVEIARVLKSKSKIQLRMGIEILDVNARVNVAGAGDQYRHEP